MSKVMLFGGAGDSEIVGFSDATLRVNELFSTSVIFPDTDCGAAGVCASCGLSVVTAAWTLPVAGANVQTASARARPTKTDTPTLVSFFIAKSLLSFMGAGAFDFARGRPRDGTTSRFPLSQQK